MFIYLVFERERASQGGAEKEREREIPSRLCTVSEKPGTGLELTNQDIIT